MCIQTYHIKYVTENQLVCQIWKFISTFVYLIYVGDSRRKDSGGNDKRLETKMGNSVAGTKVHLK